MSKIYKLSWQAKGTHNSGYRYHETQFAAEQELPDSSRAYSAITEIEVPTTIKGLLELLNRHAL